MGRSEEDARHRRTKRAGADSRSRSRSRERGKSRKSSRRKESDRGGRSPTRSRRRLSPSPSRRSPDFRSKHRSDQGKDQSESEARARDKYERIQKRELRAEKTSEEDGKRENEEKKPEEKQKPNFGLSGKLAEDTNVYNGVVVKYNEPPEARAPKRKWRLYPFKGEEALPFIPIHKQSGFLLGRDRKVVDVAIDHPSCSKQHAVIQFRCVEFNRDDETLGKRIRPYIIDLESANGTYVNNQKIEPRRYYELFEKDVIKFGYSSREYVVLHEESKEEDEDDDLVLAIE